MARPQKKGLDYFPLDVDFFTDEKIEYVSARFDEKGELLVIRLLCAIYREGYYTTWNEDKATIFAKRAGRNVSPQFANDVVLELVKRDFFDRDMFDSFGILTSRGIQERFMEARKRRQTVEVTEDYWLLDRPEERKTLTLGVIDDNNPQNGDNNDENGDDNPQKKGKEKKEKETIKKERIEKESKEKEKKKEVLSPPDPPWGEPDVGLEELDSSLSETVQDWFRYKDERGESYHPTGKRSLIAEIRHNAGTYGSTPVCGLIRQCMSSNYKGIIWNKLEGKPPPPNLAEANQRAGPATNTNPALHYPQRQYDDDQMWDLFD